jgi:hypothetical protein
VRRLRDLEGKYAEACEATSTRDADASERPWQDVQNVAKAKAHMQSVAAGRRLAERQLAEIARFGKRERLLEEF